MKRILGFLLIAAIPLLGQISGLLQSSYFNEQTITFKYKSDIRVHINTPSVEDFDDSKRTELALFALPNGNTIEQTVGKVLDAGDDWHFDIQHIGAQTRFLREHVTDRNIVTIYLESAQLSWPAWKSAHADHDQIIKGLTEYLLGVFQEYDPYLVLTGHSGGGRFTFSFLDGVTEIPSTVKRISFLDSNYGYEHNYGDKIISWLNASDDHYLSVIAYNDSVALLNGNPVVSATGGTWYRSRIMKNYMASSFSFTDTEDEDFIKYTALDGRIKFILKKNPAKEILHTVQVEKNGYIQGMVSGTDAEEAGYVYYGARSYSDLVQENIKETAQLTIPPRPADARTGSQFMQDVMNMSFAEREEEIYDELAAGNIPDFMRTLTTITAQFQDAAGNSHTVEYEVMPDYLAIGSNDDFCRIPMGPITAQNISDLYGAVMPTRKLVDNIYTHCEIKLSPVTYTPVGNQNELVPKFIEHNTAITNQFNTAGGVPGDLTGGTKKDVVLSNLIIAPNRPDHVCIYGWHQLNGQPIQPLTNIHIDTYVDYSHGIRFLNEEILLDGEVMSVENILKDQNLYKVLSDESGIMAQPSYIADNTLPEKPTSFGVRSSGAGSIEILLETDPKAESYRVYMGTDADNLAESGDYPSGDITISDLTDGQIYFFKLQAVNESGTSTESEVLAGIPGNAPAEKALIVNGFDRGSTGNTYNFVSEHGKAIYNSGIWFESASNDAVTDGFFDLSDYYFVDYILGDESTADETFSNTEQGIVKNYLNGGGNLFVSGSELAWDLDWKGSSTDKSFINGYLKSAYLSDAPGSASGTYYELTPVAGEMFDQFSAFNFDNGTHGGINVLWPDVLNPVNGGVSTLLYSGFNAGNGTAGISYKGVFPDGTEEGSILVFGVPFEAIYLEETRFQIMGEILSWVDAPNAVTEEDQELPLEYSLKQNYPNPFNPSTKINFTLKNDAVVNLEIYDMKGERVNTLVNGELSSGSHSVVFNAGGYASGVYLYRLLINDLSGAEVYSAQNKMILLK